MFYGTVEISRVITITHQSCLHKIKNFFVQKQNEVATSVIDLDIINFSKDSKQTSKLVLFYIS